MTDPEFEAYVANASADLERKQQRLEAEYGIGRRSRFFIDYERSILQFFEGEALRVDATFFRSVPTFQVPTASSGPGRAVSSPRPSEQKRRA